MNAETPKRTLGELFHFKNGRAFKKTEWGNKGLPIIRIQNLNDDTAQFNYFKGTYEQEILVRENDLLFSWSGTVGSSFGPHIWMRQDGLLNQHIFKIGFKTDIESRYAYFALDYITEEIERSVNGAVGLVHITKEKLNQFTIPVPSKANQQRIVTILDEAFDGISSARASAEKNLQNTREVFESQLNSIFSIPGPGWVERKLSETCTIARGGSPRPIKAFFTDAPDGVNWIKISDATSSSKYIYSTMQKIKASGVSRSRLVHDGDFILSNSMSFGRPYIMKTTGCIHDGWLVLSDYASSFDQDFLYLLLGSQFIYRQFDQLAAGSTVRNLNIDLASGVVIPVPPLKEQERLAEVLGSFDENVQQLSIIYQHKIEKLDELKQSFLHRAFNGQL